MKLHVVLEVKNYIQMGLHHLEAVCIALILNPSAMSLFVLL